MPLTFEKSRHGDYWIVRDGFKTGIINLRLDGLFYFRSDGNDKYSLDDLKEIIEYMRQLGAVARGSPIFFKNIGNYCYEVSWDNDIEPTDYPYNIGIIEKMQYYQSFYHSSEPKAPTS